MRSLKVALVVIFAVTSLSGCERYRLDRKMEELCKQDGGVKIYETVTLSPVEYEELSKYVITKKSIEEYYGPEYRYVQNLEYIVGKDADPNKGQGRISRGYQAIYRRSDEYLLGESVSYSRGGGDWFTFGSQPSSNHCPQPRIDLGQKIFLKGE